MADVVFLGPTLPADEAAALLPGVRVLPPVRHGDLLRLAPGPGDRVLIVDGLFLQTPPVRHREILLALERGAVVAGSSSMGALRAAELHPYGMRGAGRVFGLYRDGVVTGDDEVAMAYGPAEDGHRALSEPLVNVRVSLERATAAGVVTAAEAAVLLALARSVPFRGRSARALARAADRALTDDSARRWLDWARGHPVDVKAEDARELLRLAAAGALAPAGAGDRPIRNVRTYLLERWQARHGGQELAGRWVPDTAVVAALLALHPDVPALRRRDLLGRLAGPGAGAEARAVELARARGLLGSDGVTPGGWLGPGERALPPEEAAVRVLCRAFGTLEAACRSERALPAELLTADVVAAARRFVRRAEAVADRLPRPDPHRPDRRLYFRAEAIDALFGRLWDRPAEELASAAADRGFADLVAFRAAVEPFTALLTVGGAPEFPSVRTGG